MQKGSGTQFLHRFPIGTVFICLSVETSVRYKVGASYQLIKFDGYEGGVVQNVEDGDLKTGQGAIWGVEDLKEEDFL